MKVEEEIPTMKVVDVICDICGKSCKAAENCFGNPTNCSIEYAEILIPGGGWGYDSRKDGENHECHMCETCYDKVRSFIENELGGKIRVDHYM
jgi:hypothetical protein